MLGILCYFEVMQAKLSRSGLDGALYLEDSYNKLLSEILHQEINHTLGTYSDHKKFLDIVVPMTETDASV